MKSATHYQEKWGVKAPEGRDFVQLQLIRNATLRLTYHNQLILIDPYFAPKHTLPSYADKSLNPLVDLPLPTADPSGAVPWSEATPSRSLHIVRAVCSVMTRCLFTSE